MTAIANLPDLRPSLLLDFANSGRVDPRIQCNRASSATCFGPDGKLRTVAANVPRIDYDPVTGKCLGLLVEEARTNLYTNSDSLGLHEDPANVTKVLSAGIAPDGSNTAVKLTEVAAAGIKRIRWWDMSSRLSASVEYTFSFFAKAAGRPVIDINGVGFSTISFNCNTGQVSGVDAIGTSAKMQQCPNGWWRCTFIRLLNSSVSPGNPYFDLRLNNGAGQDYLGDGVSGVLLWGMQVELGGFPTSYIPTAAAQVTRAADAVAITGANFSSWYRRDEGALYVEWEKFGSSNFQSMISLSDGTANNAIVLAHSSGAPNNNVRFDVNTGGVNQAALSIVSPSVIGTIYKTAASYKVNDFAAVANGAIVQTKSSGSVPTVSRMYIGANGLGSGGYLSGYIRRNAYYPKRLTNEQLQRLTA